MRPTSKITALVAFFICFSLVINAQSKTSALKKIYGQMGGGPVSKSGSSGNFAFQSVWKNNLVGTLSYQSVSANPKNLPSDYKRGYSYFILLPVPDAMPEQEISILSLTVGKLFSSGRKTWFTTEAGISLVKGDKFTFNRQAVQNENLIFVGYSTSNYTIQKESTSGMGGQLKVDFSWAFCSFAGLGVGVHANVNAVQSVIGTELKINIGWMNRGQKNK